MTATLLNNRKQKSVNFDTVSSNLQTIQGCLFFLYARRLGGYTATTTRT